MIELCLACHWLLDYGACGCPDGRPMGPIVPATKDGNGEWVLHPAESSASSRPEGAAGKDALDDQK